MVIEEIKKLLERHAGWNPESLGARTVDLAVAERMKVCGVAEPNAYLDKVRFEFSERDALVEHLCVPETWFFRDGEPFKYLERWVRSEWLPSHPGQSFRVLSLPCSTGEEPYSLAMTLNEAGLPWGRLSVDAFDLSEKSLAKARKGFFRPSAFRSAFPYVRQRFFETVDGGFQVNDQLRQAVRFAQGNILDSSLGAGAPPYHVVFSRNVLIYFHKQARLAALGTLGRLMVEGGRLCVGHADSIDSLDLGWKNLGESGAFIYVRRPVITRPVPSSTTRLPAPSPAPADLPPVDGLAEAARLAGAGRLSEAATLCENAMRTGAPAARAFALMGTIRVAERRRDDAAACFEKALYLEPNHYEALIQLAIIRDTEGDVARATALRRRASRTAEGGGGQS